MNENEAITHVVDMTSRLAQWRIDNFDSTSRLESQSFKIGDWDWNLVLKKKLNFVIKLVPALVSSGHDPLIASLKMRVVSLVGGRKTLARAGIWNQQVDYTQEGQKFVWVLEVPLTRRFIIEVEFLDLKTASPNGGEPRSVWSEGFTGNQKAKAVAGFGRLLSESIHTDIVIHASDGSIGAHRAVLAPRSLVFDSMFTHNLKEKELSAVNIPDMSIEACQAFLSYIYSNNMQYEDFLTHRLDLLRSADKYDVADLKDACEESLIKDIGSENVLERLQIAFMYSLPRLKVCCIKYLVKFGKIFDIEKEFNAFVQSADRELVSEVVDKIISAWKGV
ncbi:SKP1/BTB/POZ domain-containing protein [Artemisia annua]|uniref:SKP1/BTB/POZ domain-containing protein n=1 Tax=Artemisia annua TaxID=35608 RepID=A0A2U1NCG4_ARTAN|nr:SKP1/BTB/POZ domain-containing protein [Artemisia annua]